MVEPVHRMRLKNASKEDLHFCYVNFYCYLLCISSFAILRIGEKLLDMNEEK